MSPASWPRDEPGAERLLLLETRNGELADRRIADLPDLLLPGDLLVLNDAATLPASLFAADGQLELRLARRTAAGSWQAVVFGPGDWRTATELRPLPRRLVAGQRLELRGGFAARVASVDAESGDPPRLVELRFELEGADFWRMLYRHARPVQYAYLKAPLELWHVQTGFATRPWAVELASAGRPLSWDILLRARKRGVELAFVTHAAGLSSTGSASLDARLPLAERYEISEATSRAVQRARARGQRVIAAGTSVVRALESGAALAAGDQLARSAETELVIDARHRLKVVNALLTGIHEPGSSHFALLEAFAPRSHLERALEHAARGGYLAHEFGDSLFISALPEVRSAPRGARDSQRAAPFPG